MEPLVSFCSAKWTTPTWGKFWICSCKDRTATASCLRLWGDSGGEAADFAECSPSKFKGGTKSILPARWGPRSGLYIRGVDEKLPVNKGDVNGVGSADPGAALMVVDAPLASDNLIPLLVQNVSRARAWWKTLPESGLLEASTRRTPRLQPKEALFSLDTIRDRKTVLPLILEKTP